MKLMDFTSIALKNLFSKPVTSNYPFEPASYPERSRGHIEIDINKCILCGICMRKCPSGAITVDRAGKTWSIERMGCVQCENCVGACPKKCLSIQPGYTAPSTEMTVYKFDIPGAKAPAKPAAPKAAPKPAETAQPKTETAPAAPAAEPQEEALTSGKIVNDINTCILCGLCSRACPADAITVDRAAKTWSINRDECIQCGACIDGCKKFKCLKFAEDDGETGVVTLSKDGSAAPAAKPSVQAVPKASEKPAPKAEAKVKKERPNLDYGKIANDIDDCILCGLCSRACPVSAIEVDRKENKTWSIDRDKCVQCGVCIDACRAKHSLYYEEDDFEDGVVTLKKEG